MKTVIIAGTHSGSGKTTITISIMNAFKKVGKIIAPFKIGHDYIDPKFHFMATGTKSYNLDAWMNDKNTIRFLAEKHLSKKDFGIIEGVMGLYDGYDFGTKASTAHVAKVLNAPVILVVDTKGISTSICAMILGYKTFDPEVNIKGIILNNISSEEYYNSLKKIVKEKTGCECFGYFPKIKDVQFKSRQLGLVPTEEIRDIEEQIDYLSDIAKKTIDLDKIEKIALKNETEFKIDKLKNNCNGEELRIGIAKDKAFSFYYEDNIELMKECGLELIEFSPLDDKRIPDRLDRIYLGGGFPEEFAKDLSENSSMIEDFRQNLENGMPLFAECGGLMYLTEGITDKKGKYHRTVGFFNCKTRMTEKLQRFGYVEVELNGMKINAHEFHHSELEMAGRPNFEFKYKVKKLNKNKEWTCGLSRKNVLAGYPHFHFYSSFEFFNKIVELFRSNKK